MALTPAQLKKLRKSDGGNRIRAARQLVGLTQEQLAPLVGLTQAGLSDLERRRYGDTNLSTAQKFSEFFGCAIEDLFPARQQQAVAS
jgi:DNA-binding XRE family transcriptional regulator